MELDLIEISPKAEPPVCRIADYQKFLYQQKKKAKELKANQVKVVIKEIRFGPQTDDHDYNFKLKHATNFLKEGCKVKAYVFFRGRSIVFKEQGRNPAAPLRHRPRRGRQSGDDAQARRQEDEHDAGAQNQQEVAAERFRHRAKRLYPIHNRGPGRESDCGFYFMTDASGRETAAFHTPAEADLQACTCGNGLWGNCGKNFRERRGQAFGEGLRGGASGRGFREQGTSFGDGLWTDIRKRYAGNRPAGLIPSAEKGFCRISKYIYLCNEMITQDDIFGITDDAAFEAAALEVFRRQAANARPTANISRWPECGRKRCARPARFHSCRSKSSRPTTSIAAARSRRRSSPRRQRRA